MLEKNPGQREAAAEYKVDGHSTIDTHKLIQDLVDHLAPKLDTYEIAIYLYLLRHGRLLGQDEIVIGFKSARREIALGIGEKGKPMSEGTCYEKLRTLEQKGCIRVIGTERQGTKLRAFLPAEIPGILPQATAPSEATLEELDFFEVPEHRIAIVRREGNRCFYCLRAIDESNYVIEHVVSRPTGSNGYRNVVAACRGCNNRKNDTPVDEYLRRIYRAGILSAEELEERLQAIEKLKTGALRPTLGGAVAAFGARR